MTGLLKVAVPALGVLLLTACVAGAVVGAAKLFADPSTRATPAVVTEPASAPQVAIPLIDAAAPIETETATFALG